MMDDHAIDQKPVETIVVFDLETTGINTQTIRITEMAAVAVSRENFIDCLEQSYDRFRISDNQQQQQHQNNKEKFNFAQPRVLSKICLPINPEINIEFTASKISGLKNEALKGCGTFVSAFNAFTAFLENLTPPVCLVAHNGRKFDFTVLRNEIRRHFFHNGNCCQLPNRRLNLEDIFLFDTYLMFPKLDRSYFQNVDSFHASDDVKQEKKMTQIDGLVVQQNVGQILTYVNQKRCVEGNLIQKVNGNDVVEKTIDNVAVVDLNQRDQILDMPLDKRFCVSTSPLGNVEKKMSTSNFTVLRRQESSSLFTSSSNGCTPIMSHSTNSLETTSFIDSSDYCKSTVFDCKRNGSSFDQSSTTKSIARRILTNRFLTPPIGYKQSEIFQRIYGQSFDGAHTADGDCCALLKLLLAYGRDFLNTLDNEKKSFKLN